MADPSQRGLQLYACNKMILNDYLKNETDLGYTQKLRYIAYVE